MFEKAGGAVYKVRTERGLGSAVAISDSELLTNCHVVEDFDEVKIMRAKDEQTAKVISKNADADRCVLRATAKLPKWVSVRPYEDIKVGERAVTIGTPQGLELTVAEGIVSSKRVFNRSRVIQTSAPISQGSSGGGLFDAARPPARHHDLLISRAGRTSTSPSPPRSSRRSATRRRCARPS